MGRFHQLHSEQTSFVSIHIVMLVERYWRYVRLAKVKNKDTESVASARIKQAKKLPTDLYKSLSWDIGKELADLQRFTLATNIEVSFCDLSSPVNGKGVLMRALIVFSDSISQRGLIYQFMHKPIWPDFLNDSVSQSVFLAC